MSPIRPENLARYPEDWPTISLAIKERAGWRCECLGECGRGTHDGRCPNRHGEPAYGTGSRVVLTTAHLNHTPEDCHPENLRAMCQGCHLHYDREHHAQTRAETRRREIAASGQGDLLAEYDALRAGVRETARDLWLAVAIPEHLFPREEDSAAAASARTAAGQTESRLAALAKTTRLGIGPAVAAAGVRSALMAAALREAAEVGADSGAHVRTGDDTPDGR